MKKINIYFLLIIIIIASCDETLDYETINIPVVEGYLYEGKSIDSLKISNIINYGNEEQLDFLEITNIQIKVNEEVFPLIEIKRDSTITFKSEEDFIIEEGESYELSFNYGDELISATTTGIAKPDGLSMSQTSIYIERVSSGSFPSFDNETIEIIWDNPEDDYFYLVIKYLEEEADPVMEDFDLDPFDIVGEPMQTDVYNIHSRMLMHYGEYMVVLFRVTQDYANMFERIDNTSQSLTEPYSNIENGKGIFTAIASDTIFFNVYEGK